jgi:hypothetical protein
VIEILHKARKQKSKARGKLAQQKFFATLKETLANNSDENAKSYLENIADMREKMRSANGGDSDLYFGKIKMLELKGETHKTQRQREAIEEEYRFKDQDCESCMRREWGKYKTRKLTPRMKRKVPNLENERDEEEARKTLRAAVPASGSPVEIMAAKKKRGRPKTTDTEKAAATSPTRKAPKRKSSAKILPDAPKRT